MRPLFLDSPTIDFGRGILILPILLLLYVLAPFSNRAEATLNEVFGKEEDEEVSLGPVPVLVITDGTVGEDEQVVPVGLTTGLEQEE